MFQKTSALSPEHVAPVYSFLASQLASEVTGQVLTVAGSRLRCTGSLRVPVASKKPVTEFGQPKKSLNNSLNFREHES